MGIPSSRRRNLGKTSTGRLCGSLTVALLVSGCGWLLFPDRAERIQISLDGTASTPLNLVTSDRFVLGSGGGGPEGALVFLVADTASVDLPFDEVYDITPTGRFALRISAPSGDTADVRLRVWVDGDQVHEDRMSMTTGAMQFFTVRN